MREYRRGDPMKRIDWRRFASGGDLTTVEFRRNRPPRSCCASTSERRRHRARTRRPADRPRRRSGVAAADRLAAALADANHEFGLAALGPEPCWLPLGVGRAHLAQLRHLLDTDLAFAPSTVAARRSDAEPFTPEDGLGDVAPEVSDSPRGPTVDQPGAPGAEPALSDGGQTVVDDQGHADATSGRDRQTAELGNASAATPDNATESAGRRRHPGDGADPGGRHPVTVVSPDTTAGESVGNRLAARERTTRIRALRRLGVPVVDWQTR